MVDYSAKHWSEKSKKSAESSRIDAEKASKYANKNLGDIFYSLRTDTPVGASLCDGTIFDKAQFTDSQNKSALWDLLVNHTIPTVSFSEYETELADNGSCGYFGLDVDLLQFRVPFLQNIYIKSSITSSNTGKFQKESLPQHQHDVNVPLRTDLKGGNTNGCWADSGTKYTRSSNALESTGVYKDGGKVNPDAIYMRPFVQLYISAVEASQAQAAEFMTLVQQRLLNDGSNSLDTALQNIAQNSNKEGKETIVGWGMPSNRYINLSLGPDDTRYTAPANGYFILHKTATALNQYINITNETIGSFGILVSSHTSATAAVKCFCPCKKGDVVYIGYNLGGATTAFRFVYLEGVK